MYDETIAEVETALTGLPFTERGRKAVATVLTLAMNFGAGDAYAGHCLKSISYERLAEMYAGLKLSGKPPECGGMVQAMLLLDCQSEYPAVEAMLQRLNRGARAGTGQLM
jgi:hypothetical protein